MIITNTTIIDSASKSENGGAIYGLNVKVTNSTLSNNAANRNGGAIYVVENITTANSTFSNNTASTSNGGAMYSGNDISVIEFMDSTFIHNEAVSGGVAHVENSSLSITNSVCNDNEASEDGGGARHDIL